MPDSGAWVCRPVDTGGPWTRRRAELGSTAERWGKRQRGGVNGREAEGVHKAARKIRRQEETCNKRKLREDRRGEGRREGLGGQRERGGRRGREGGREGGRERAGRYYDARNKEGQEARNEKVSRDGRRRASETDGERKSVCTLSLSDSSHPSTRFS